MQNTQFFKHHFLIAMPSLRDSNFHKSVIYLYEHSAEGAMGLIVNIPLQINLGNILQHLKINISDKHIKDEPVIMGGPVQPEQGFVIYPTSEEDRKEGLDIVISSTKETLVAIANGKGPEKFMVTLGYSGWGAGQLEQEINRNDWLVAPFDLNILFATPIHQRWVKSAKLIGVDINTLSSHFGHA